MVVGLGMSDAELRDRIASLERELEMTRLELICRDDDRFGRARQSIAFMPESGTTFRGIPMERFTKDEILKVHAYALAARENMGG